MGGSASVVSPLLNSAPLFSGLDENNLKKILAQTIVKDYKKGDTIFSIGDESNELYIIEDGEVSICGLDDNGEVKLLSTRQTLEYFGEVNLQLEASHNHRSTQATVESDFAKLLVLNMDVLKKLETYEWFKPIMRNLRLRSASSIAQTLKTIPFLSHIPEPKLRLLAELFSFVTFKQEEVICKQALVHYISMTLLIHSFSTHSNFAYL